MDLCLYVNTFLTPKAAHENVPSNYPSPFLEDSEKKPEILLLSLNSLRHLNIKKIVLNVEVDEQYDISDRLILEQTKSIFPSAEILAEKKRPTSIDQWKESTEFAAKFFGEENPVICVFNHDHIFVDPIPSIFQDLVIDIFERNQDIFFINSHAPEVISFLNDFRSYNFRLRQTFNWNVSHTPPKKSSGIAFEYQQKGFIDGSFVTSVRALRKMWNGAVVSSDYIPRPDWAGLTFGNHVFNIISTQREFFRHFDGYGHATSIPYVLGMGLSGFDEHGDTSYRRLMSDISSDESFRLRTTELISAYSDIFCKNYLVLLRDLHYSRQLARIKKTSPRQDFLKAFQIFLESQVMIDLSYLKISDHEAQRFIYLMSNDIFVRQNELFGLISQDVGLWSVARKPLFLRALSKVKNVFFRIKRKLIP